MSPLVKKIEFQVNKTEEIKKQLAELWQSSNKAFD